ncbi:MAG: hypothetical protein CVV53_00200 [Spirochaetae bacterium HGW-Spirochaetae-9]|nr:MAG: hypothetical protein CVV53_00200 [Spirochaetae bacterium HGW-Spirochaetae-9]
MFFLFGQQTASQSAQHQRTGVQSDQAWQFMAGLSIDMVAAAGMEDGEALELDPSITFEALYKQSIGVSVELPVIARLSLSSLNSPGSAHAAAFGDPSMAVAYTFRAGDWRLGTELCYTHPLGIWNDYEANEKNIASGSGYRKLGATLSAVRYLDPLVAGFAASVDTLYDRREKSGSMSLPLVLTASIFATEALNSIVAISGGLSQRLAWPRCLNGISIAEGYSHSLSGKLAILFSEGAGTASFGLAKQLSDSVSPIVFSLGYSLRLGDKEG